MTGETITVPTEIALNLKVAYEDNSERYDASARNLVAEKPVLAYILKSALDEYKDCTVQEIAEKFIEGTPQVRENAVHQDHPDREGPAVLELNADEGADGMMSGDEKAEGLPTVDKSSREGAVYYDIRFLAVVPKSGELIEIYVNIEIQNNDTPGYPLTMRGIYYGARMISSQRGTVFKNQEYGKIKRVVSIWVCEDTAESRSDSINRYSFTEECRRGDFHEPKANYDLMTVVILRLGAHGEKSGDNAIRLLSRMFSLERTYEEKIKALSEEFKISVTKEMSKEVLNVCNLSTGVYNKGVSQGRREGRQEGRLDTLLELVKDGILSITDAAKRADMKVSDFEKAYRTFLL